MLYKKGLLIFDDLKSEFKEICQDNDKMASFIESMLKNIKNIK